MKVKRMVAGVLPAAVAIAVIPLGAPAQAAWSGHTQPQGAHTWDGPAWPGAGWTDTTRPGSGLTDPTLKGAPGAGWTDATLTDTGLTDTGWTDDKWPDGVWDDYYPWDDDRWGDYPWGDYPWQDYTWASPGLYAKPGQSLYVKYLSPGGPLEARWVKCGPWSPGDWADWKGKVGDAVKIQYTGDGSAFLLGSGFKGGSCVKLAVRSLDGRGPGPYPVKAYFG